MSSTSVPQLFLSAASPYAQPGSIDSGFRSPLAWMTKSAPVATQGYYYPLVGKKFWVLGSSSDCNIVFSNDYISSHHALLLATADRAIYFCDLQSVNGSFVNEAQVFVPTLLKHGDLLRIGPLEIEFQHTSEFPVGHTPVPARVVLLLQPSEAQAAIWSAILKACNIAVIYESKAPQEREQFASFIPTLEKLPDLLLADMETLKPNPYAFVDGATANTQISKLY